MSELGLETPPAATLHSSPEEDDDVVGPPNIKRVQASTNHDASVPGAFAEYGKTRQDTSCQHEECNQDEDTRATGQFPTINMTWDSTKPILSSSSLKRKNDLFVNANKSSPSSSMPTAQAMHLPPDPTKDRKQFNTHVAKTICQCGVHNHTFTCRKPPNGWEGCRLCKPSALSDGTKPTELRFEIKPDGSEQCCNDRPPTAR